MKSQTTIGKAFEINKDAGIYGAFAEIGAGQETVNFFFKAGLASQTVAKSMSAYDMTVSDQIYGKQNRYVCKDRLLTMLNHEYHLLDKRLKRKIGKKTRFFVFATTAVTSTRKKGNISSEKQQAWMGLRFQAKPGQAFNEILFHVNCLDKNRLQQHEALGILGVNLIYSGFHWTNHPEKLISSLKENLSHSRIEIHAMSCLGPAFKSVSAPALNLELLSQRLSSMAFFPSEKKSEFLLDATFDKSLLILYGVEHLANNFQKEKSKYLKSLDLEEKKSACILFLPKEQLMKRNPPEKFLKDFCSKGFSVLITSDLFLEDLKLRLNSYSSNPLLFIISGKDFKNKLFDSHFYKNRFLLKSLGNIFDQKTKVAVLSKEKSFSVEKYKLKAQQEQILKDYLVQKKQILDLKC